MEKQMARQMNRRSFMRAGALAAAAGSLWPWRTAEAAPACCGGPTRREPAFKLPDLPYAFDALEPIIDARTMEIHHGRHHAAYVRNAAEALAKYPAYAGNALETLLTDIPSLPPDIQVSMRNNGGGHWNHMLFWEVMAPDGGGEPGGDLAAAMDAQLGGFDQFREAFSSAAATRFGSGWAWLIVKDDGELAVTSTPNQDNPLMRGLVDTVGAPILGLDVWEHAYYLKYQNRRGDYINAWWEVVNWPRVEALYRVAKG